MNLSVCIFVCILLFVLNTADLLAQKVKFDHFTLKEGLSQSTVNYIYQDSKGFLWIGTQDGLNKYDGYVFTVYKPDPENNNSLSNGFIQCIYEDRTGIIWVGTYDGGLNRFDPRTKTFTHYLYDEKNENSASNNNIKSVTEDNHGNLWIGTWGGGVNLFNPHTSQFTRFKARPGDAKTVSHDKIKCVYKDKKGDIWIGTSGGGLNKYDKATQKFIRFYHNENDTNTISNNEILCINEDTKGHIWIGTNGGGLNKYDPASNTFKRFLHDDKNKKSLIINYVSSVQEDEKDKIWIGTVAGISRLDPITNEFLHYTHNPSDLTSISGNDILCLYKDMNGILWIGTSGDGLNKYDYFKQRFIHFKHEPNNPNSLINNDVSSILETQNGEIWAGTNGGGLDRYNPVTKLFANYGVIKENSNSLSSFLVKCLAEDQYGNIWIGTFGGGLNKFNPHTQQFTHYLPNSANIFSINNMNIKCFYIDKKNNLWIGTYGGGLNMLSLKENENTAPRFIHYKHVESDYSTISNNFINGICEDKKGDIWIATWEGINKIETGTDRITCYKNKPDDSSSLSNNHIMCIHFDSREQLWAGTHGGGLNRIEDFAKGTFRQYTAKDGLPSNVINAITEDNQGNLWFSTNGGISKLNYQTTGFKNYDERDGLQSNEFNQGAFYKGYGGSVYFGGINGFNVFIPDKINDNVIKPPISIISFKKFDKEVPLDQSIEYIKDITLAYHENFISFEFTAMNFTIPEKNQYAYLMDGFDKNWVFCGIRRYASYTNLDPGTYFFRVKGSNNDGVWNEKGTSIKITISPPFWRTTWFYILSIVTIIISIYSYIKIRIKNLEHTKKILETKVMERTMELNVKNTELAQKNKDITDSINYAKKIQDAIMLPEEEIFQVIPDAFIYYRPKDIVSGDFYWFYEITNGSNSSECIMAAIDCTGHGVPGAFMSMIGNNLLNQAIIEQKIFQPAKILNILHEGVSFALHQDKADSETKDGMDIALCKIDLTNRVVEYAGAHRPLIILKDGDVKSSFNEVKADKVGIGGGSSGGKIKFQNHKIELSKGDIIYMFSDGFVDQFGGKNNKKYMSRRFKEFLTEIRKHSMKEQKEMIRNEITTWKGDLEQTDDILIIGIRF